ncbi:MAG: MFS transporter [Tissierellia bacterium]|nr:MFS transporter [Tissierellia bacterium]
MNKKKVGRDLFYGWYIVAAGFIIMGTAFGIAINCASLFIKPISDDLGFSRSAINATLTLRQIVMMFIAVFAGRIFSKFDIKRMMRVSTIVLFVSFFSLSFSKSILMFYFLTIILSISVSLLAIIPVSLIINNWFHEKRGLAIGIAFMGSGVGGMIFNSLAGHWIMNYGWQRTYQILALIMLLFIFPCTFFILHIKPKDIGLKAFGEAADFSQGGSGGELKGVTLAEALKSHQFWLVFLIITAISICISTLMTSISPHLSDIGYSVSYSANIVALSMGSLALGKIALGYLYDRLGITKTNIISGIATVGGILGLLYGQYFFSLVLIIIGSGLGCAFGTIANPIITQEVFGAKDYTSIYGLLSAASSLGGIISPVLNGVFYDKTGSYNTFFIISATIGLMSIFMQKFVFSKEIKA